MTVSFDWTITVGNVVNMASVLVALTGFWLANRRQNADIALKTQERMDARHETNVSRLNSLDTRVGLLEQSVRMLLDFWQSTMERRGGPR